MMEYVSQTGSSMKVRIRYNGNWFGSTISGQGLYGESGSDQVAYNEVLRSCNADFNFLVKFDC